MYIPSAAANQQALAALADLRSPEELQEALAILRANVIALQHQTHWFFLAPQQYYDAIASLLEAGSQLERAIAAAHQAGDSELLGLLVWLKALRRQLQKLLAQCEQEQRRAA